MKANGDWLWTRGVGRAGAGLVVFACCAVVAVACSASSCETCDGSGSATCETIASDVTGHDASEAGGGDTTSPCAARECGLVQDPDGPAGLTRICGWCPDGQVCRAGLCAAVPCWLSQDCASESPLGGGLTHACVRPDLGTAGTCRYALADQGEVLTNFQRMYEGAALYLTKPRLTSEGEPAPCTFPASQGVTPIEGTCCSAQGGYDRDHDNRCDPDPAAWSTPTWADLGVTLADQHELVYRFGRDEAPSGGTERAPFVLEAYGDLDCNTLQETFTVVGRRGDEGACTVAAPSSVLVSLPQGYGERQPVTIDLALPDNQRAGFIGGASNARPWVADGRAFRESFNPHFDEAKLQLQRLAEGVAASWRKGASGACAFPSPLPVSPLEGACCASQGGNDPDQNMLCNPRDTDWRGGWSDLGFALTTEHAFVYATQALSPTRMRVVAYGDLDCDTVQSTFVRFVQGTDTGAACEATILPGWYIENENE